MGYRIPIIDLGKFKEVTAVLKLQTQFSPKGSLLNQIFIWSEKIYVFNALNDGVDQNFGTFFKSAVSIELWAQCPSTSYRINKNHAPNCQCIL